MLGSKLPFALLALIAGRSLACAQGVLDQFWPEVNGFVETSPQTRLFLLYAGARVRAGGYTDGTLGAHMDFYFAPIFTHRAEHLRDTARSRLLMIRAGYLYGRTPEDAADPFVEHTATLEGTARFYVRGNALVSNRNRFDFRFVDGAFTPRYRNRLKIERTFRTAKRAITPYAHAEAFYDWRYDAFHRFRFSAGSELELNRIFVVDAYYLRQQDSRATPKGFDVAGIALQIYFQ